MGNLEYKKILNEAYRRYQLDWMVRHGKSIGGLLNAVRDNMAKVILDEDFLPEGGTEEDAERLCAEAAGLFLDSTGFGSGEIFACRDEFENMEFTDTEYMRGLLGERLFKKYLEATDMQELEQMRVKTPHCDIAVEPKGAQDDYPGIYVYLPGTGNGWTIDDLAVCVEYSETDKDMLVTVYEKGGDEPVYVKHLK